MTSRVMIAFNLYLYHQSIIQGCATIIVIKSLSCFLCKRKNVNGELKKWNTEERGVFVCSTKRNERMESAKVQGECVKNV